MNIEEFEMTVRPGGKRSRIEPFQAEVFALKTKGYADGQIRDWLKLNGLDVSRQAVQQFVKRGIRPKPSLAFSHPTSSTPTTMAARQESLTPKGEAPPEPAEEGRPLTLQEQRARRKQLGDKFFDSNGQPKSNPIVKQLNLKVGAQNESKRPGEPEKFNWDPETNEKPEW